MGKIIVADIETNGFYRKCTAATCIGIGDYDTGKVTVYHGDAGLAEAISQMLEAPMLVGHNILSFDVPVLEKLYDLQFDRERIWDTLVLSRLYFPERTADNLRHGLEDWGKTLGLPKLAKRGPSFFAVLSPELIAYNHRDVEVNMKILDQILTRAGENEADGYKL